MHRREFMGLGAGVLAALGLPSTESWAASLRRAAAIKIGGTDWSMLLEGKIEDMYNDLAQMSGEGGAVVEAIEASYRRVHGICGIGPTVGFTRTGRMAREVEAVLLEAYRTHRGLTATEVASFQKKLHVLRETAKSELQLTYSSLR